MIKLANNAKVLAAYVTIPDTGGRSSGLVLAETETDFVTWNIWCGDEVRDIYEADTGHYFHKRGEMERGADRQEAEIDYGRRLSRHITANMYNGMQRSEE
jgi:hypothetical protein